MNETMQTLLTRRSVRTYRPDPIPDDLMDQVLLAGQRACTARSQQPWHFAVVTDQKLLSWVNGEAIAALLTSGKDVLAERARQPGFHVFHRAPAVVFVAGQSESVYAVTDCANATQNMTVAAHALGLGSCFTTTFHVGFGGGREAELSRRLHLPDGYTPLYALTLGVPDGEPGSAPALREGAVARLRGQEEPRQGDEAALSAP